MLVSTSAGLAFESAVTCRPEVIKYAFTALRGVHPGPLL